MYDLGNPNSYASSNHYIIEFGQLPIDKFRYKIK